MPFFPPRKNGAEQVVKKSIQICGLNPQVSVFPPETSHGSPENTLLEKENHLPNHHILRFYVILRGVFFWWNFPFQILQPTKAARKRFPNQMLKTPSFTVFKVGICVGYQDLESYQIVFQCISSWFIYLAFFFVGRLQSNRLDSDSSDSD